MPAKPQRRREWGSVDDLPSGQVRARYNVRGKRYSVLFESRIDARNFLNRTKRQIAENTWEAPEGASEGRDTDTLAGYARRWLATRTNRHGDHLRPRTRSEYERLLAGPLESLGSKRLDVITPAAVRSWYAEQIDAGTKTQAARAYGLLRAVMNTAVIDGRVKSNPCQVRGAQSATTGKTVKPPTSAQLAKIVDRIPDRYKAAVLIAAWAGTRYGELTELRRKDLAMIKTDGRVTGVVVNIGRAVTHVAGEGFIVGPTKNEGVRAVALPPHIFPAVLEHLKTHVEQSPDSLLFPPGDNGGTHLAESTFYKHWDPARRAAKRGDMPFHALRHFGLTRYALTGATLREIQERAGHRTVAAAMRYQHAAGRDAELAAKMSELA